MSEPTFTIEAKANNQDATLVMYGDIGSCEGGITAIAVNAELGKVKGAKNLTIYLNSPGGSVFEGMAIHAAIKRFGGKVTCIIEGLAASIASIIALAADTIVMSEGSMFMIHEPHAVAIGTSSEMRKMADEIDKIRGVLVGMYAKHTGMEPAEIEKMMAAETWMDGATAVSWGFANEILRGEGKDTVKAHNKATLVVNTYRNTPVGLRTSPQDVAIAKMELRLLKHNIKRAPSAHVEPSTGQAQ